MNIKDTIAEIGLENETLPRILNQRVETIIDLQSKIVLAEKEVADEPTEESKAKLQDIKDYSLEYFNDAKEQLESYKIKLDKKANADAKIIADADAKIIADADAEAKKSKDEESNGIGGWLIGGVLLVATLGAVNIMRKK